MSELQMMSEWEEETTEEERWIIDSDSKAGWTVEQIAKKRAQRDKEVEWHLAQIEEAKARCDRETAWLTMKLEEYASMVPMRETKTQKVYKVPGGKLIIKKATTKLEHDDQRIMDDLKRQGRTEYIKTVTTEKLDWAGLKKDYLENGEAVDGITVVDVPETFEVKIEKEA